MRNTRRKQQTMVPTALPVMPRYEYKFREFVEVPMNAQFDDVDKIIQVVRGNRRFVWADVLHALPSKSAPKGDTVIVPVRKRHFIDLVWRQK